MKNRSIKQGEKLMTIQMNDYLWYKGEKFVLIDWEKGKSIIDSANFELKGFICCTDCRRGYLAEYFIDENNMLFGEKSTERYIKNEDGSFNTEFETSPKLQMNYTGSAVIAIYNNGRMGHSDFLSCYLDYDRAFELYFIDGELVEITDLAPAIKEWQDFEKSKESEPKKYNKKGYEYNREIFDCKDEITKKYLQYRYCKGHYAENHSDKS